NTGAELWNTTTGNPIYAGGAVDLANNAFYIGSDNGKLFAINLSNGNKFWSYSVGAGIKSTPIVANNKVLFGSNDGYFYALKSTTTALSSEQRLLWSYWTDGSVDATAAAIEGIVYIGSESGYVYGFSNPDLAMEFGSLKLSERDIYEGETIDISAKVFNNGSMRLSAKTNFFLYLTFHSSGMPVEEILISSHDVDLDIDEEVILHTQTTIPIRDWSLVKLSMILVKIPIENVSFPENSGEPQRINNLDIESITILEPYTGGWMSYQRDNSNKGFGDIGAKTNKTIWKYEPVIGAGQFRGSPLFAKGRIYAGAMDGLIYSIIDTTGKRDWAFNSGSAISGSPALLMSEQGNVEFDKLFFGTEAGSVHALQTNRGDLNWTYDASGEIIRASPLITHGIVYIGTMSGMLLALDEDGFFDGDQGMDETNESLANGDLIWNLTLPGAIKSTPVLAVAEDLLIVASSSGSNHQIQALNRSTRAINWSYKLSGGIDGAPVVDAQNDRVYISSNDQKVHAFDIQGFW
ncbi:MAG: PQQ-binding-like beta-propeller repeat protein, partial [Thermoplasmata archaeon]|nr:PQQ-binding-like beta-propeller repeat protein [Thermoplasmata archaeon]